MQWLKQLLGPGTGPEIPPLLRHTGWAICVVAGVVIISVLGREEVWPNHPNAVAWSFVLLGGLFLAAGIQTIGALWRWPAVYPGPAWVRLLIRVFSVGLAFAVALLLLPLAVGYVWAVLKSIARQG